MTTLYALWQQAAGVKFDSTITLGNVLTFLGVALAGVGLWRSQIASRKAQEAATAAEIAAKKDLEWRVANLETWRMENQIDGKAKELLFDKLTEIVSKLRWVDEARQKQRSAPPGKQRLGDMD